MDDTEDLPNFGSSAVHHVGPTKVDTGSHGRTLSLDPERDAEVPANKFSSR